MTDWRYKAEPRNLTTADVDERIRSLLSSPSSLGAYVPNSVPQVAVSRAFKRIYYEPAASSDYTISNTAPAEIDPVNLAGNIVVSGDSPVRVDVSMSVVTGGAAGALYLGLYWDGVATPNSRITQVPPGNFGVTYGTTIEKPRSGNRRFSLLAYRVTANGTIYCGANNFVEITVREV